MIFREKSLPGGTFGFQKLGKPIREATGEAWLSLDADLDGLHGTECHVSDELGGGGPREVYQGLVLGCEFGARDVGVLLLEELVEPEFARALCAVPGQCWNPSPKETLDSLLLKQYPETRPHAFVLHRINL